MKYNQSKDLLSRSNKILINFNIPNYLKENFDNLVKFKGQSRTSVMIDLIQSFCRQEFNKINEDKILNSLIIDITNRNRKHIEEREKSIERMIQKKNEDNELPMIPISSDYNWENSY